MAIFFTADCHFNHVSTLEKSNRPFKSIEEYHKTIIMDWNNLVNKDDTVYILGDFGAPEYANYLNGQKILICGNREDLLDKKELKKHFDFVYDRVAAIPIEYNNVMYHLRLAHRPIDIVDHPIDETHINLMGHIHGVAKYRNYGINIGVDQWNFKPVSFEQILIGQDFLLNWYDQGVFL